ncbi:MAG: GbsR/MarR family transcriptional regulator [Chloroflexota bacterium]
MNEPLTQLKQEFTEGMSQISHFWGFPKGMGAIFAALYISPRPLSLDELVRQGGLTKGAVSTNVRALARMGLVRPSTRLGDRKDYYEAETDFYKAIRAILKERHNSEFDRAVASVRETLGKLEAGRGGEDEAERQFLLERLRALQSFFDALDGLVNAVVRLEGLGIVTIEKILGVLK